MQLANARSPLCEEVMRHLPTGLVVFDGAGQLVHINPSAIALFGMQAQPADLIGQGWRALYEKLAPVLKDPDGELARIKSLIHQEHADVAEIGLRDDRVILRHYVPVFRGRAVQGAIWELQDVTATKRAHKEFSYLVEKDPVTGLFNRRGFDRRLAWLHRHPSGRKGYTLLLFDLDDFKWVNDTFGHPAGDAVLREIGQRLQAFVRDTDIAARIGGDEFAVLLPTCRTDEQALDIGQRLRRVFDTPFDIDGAPYRLTSSIGLAVQPPRDEDQSDDLALFQRADLALYEAKRAGRNRVRVFSSQMKQQFDEANQQRELLREALRRETLVVHYQPIVTLGGESASDPTVSRFEALVRLHDAEGKLRFAEEFEFALSDPKVGFEVDRFVVETVLKQLRAWQALGLDLSVAINVSPHNVAHPDFVPTIRALLQSHPDLPPRRLSFEITEHGQALNPKVISTSIADLRRIGVTVALDDFGTGNASLAHLQEFDVSVVKIDRSFVRELLRNGVDMSLSYGMLRLARMLGIGAVAEGVETRQQAQALILLGFRDLQGYLFAQPMPGEAVPEWLAQASQHLAWVRDLAKPKLDGIEQAVQALVAYRVSVRRLLARTLDAAEAQEMRAPGAAERSALGRWLASLADRCSDCPQYRRLQKALQEGYAIIDAMLTRDEPPLAAELARANEELNTAFWEWVLCDPADAPQVTAETLTN